MSNLDFKGWLVTQGISQTEVAKLLGVTIQSVNAKLNGKREFSISQIRVLCSHYGVNPQIFL